MLFLFAFNSGSSISSPRAWPFLLLSSFGSEDVTFGDTGFEDKSCVIVELNCCGDI